MFLKLPDNTEPIYHSPQFKIVKLLPDFVDIVR